MTSNHRLFLTISITVVCLLSLSAPTPVFAIKKCKDANGQWHYGDTAQKNCKKAEVTTLNDRGFKEKQADKPKTAIEIAIEEEERRKQEEELRKQQEAEEERIRILSVYETEDDIDRQRENQLNSVDTNMAVHRTFIKQTKAQMARRDQQIAVMQNAVLKKKLQAEQEQSEVKIKDSEQELKLLEQQKIDIAERFDKEKMLFRSLKAELESASRQGS